jgi:hypothetical protein
MICLTQFFCLISGSKFELNIPTFCSSQTKVVQINCRTKSRWTFHLSPNKTAYLMAKLVFLLFYGHTKKEKFIIFCNRPWLHTYILADMFIVISNANILLLFFRVKQNKKSKLYTARTSFLFNDTFDMHK